MPGRRTLVALNDPDAVNDGDVLDYDAASDTFTAAAPTSHAEAHTVASTGPHAQSGLTGGHVLRASSTTAFDFAAIQDADIPASHSGSTHAAVQAAAEATAAADVDADITTHAAITPLHVLSGTGTPEGAVTAAVGTLFARTDGGASTTLYVKESGAGNTGWVAK